MGFRLYQTRDDGKTEPTERNNMIELKQNKKQELVQAIRDYFLEELDSEISELKAVLLLDFFLKEIAPSVYNNAIADAARYMHERIDDMDGALYETEPMHR